MENAVKFRQKIAGGQPCLGVGTSFSDPAIAELLSVAGADWLWIDMEHNPLTSEAVQGQIMATRGGDTAAFVRVGAIDQALMKPVLDSGADGIILPLIKTAADTRHAVSLCRYPPEGIRGFGPRRANRWGTLGGPEFLKYANETLLVMVQIEQFEAVQNLDEILRTPGLDGVVIGPNDLASSMGYVGNPTHPEVVRTAETIIQKARNANMMVGMATGQDPGTSRGWIDKGAQFVCLGTDWSLLVGAAREVLEAVRTG